MEFKLDSNTQSPCSSLVANPKKKALETKLVVLLGLKRRIRTQARTSW